MQLSGVSSSTKLFPPNFILMKLHDFRNFCVHLRSLLPIMDDKHDIILSEVCLDSLCTFAKPPKQNCKNNAASTQINIINAITGRLSVLTGVDTKNARVHPRAIMDPVLMAGINNFC